MEEDFVIQIDTLEDLIAAVRPHLAKPAKYFVSSKSDEEIICSREKNKSKKRIHIQVATGKCMLDNTHDLRINLLPESIETLQTFHVPSRPKNNYDRVSLNAISMSHILSNGAALNSIQFPASNECFFIESHLKEHRVTYHSNKRMRVSRDNRIDILHGLRRLKMIGNTSPSVFVVEISDLIFE